MRLAPTLALLLALTAAPPAGAGTVTATTTPSGGGESGSDITYSYASGTGERDDLRVDGRSGSLRFEGTVTAGGGCAQAGPRLVTCDIRPDAGEHALVVELGDGDDRAIVVPGPHLERAAVVGGAGADDLRGAAALLLSSLEGGDGADALTALDAGRDHRLRGDGGDDRLTGSSGADDLDGGPGADVLGGGRGDDLLLGGAGDDRLDGGPDADIASWEDADTAVRVDLADPGTDGRAGERDVLHRVEGAIGGRSANDLRGDGGRNELRVAPIGRGRQRLFGRDGADVLVARGSATRLRRAYVSGGDGADTVVGVRRPRCGDGRDTYLHIAQQPLLRPRGCERFGVDRVGALRGAVRAGRAAAAAATVVLTEPAARGATLRIELRDRRGGRLLARGTDALRDGRRTQGVRLKLTRTGRALPARDGTRDVVVALSLGVPGPRDGDAAELREGTAPARLRR